MKLTYSALLVRDYDEAVAFYCGAIGFRVVEDSDMGDGKRWVVIAGEEGGGAMLLAKAKTPTELAAVGNQYGGRVGLFAHVDNFAAAQRRIADAGGTFKEQPRHEIYGVVAVFRDPSGNRWDLIEPAQ